MPALEDLTAKVGSEDGATVGSEDGATVGLEDGLEVGSGDGQTELDFNSLLKVIVWLILSLNIPLYVKVVWPFTPSKVDGMQTYSEEPENSLKPAITHLQRSSGHLLVPLHVGSGSKQIFESNGSLSLCAAHELLQASLFFVVSIPSLSSDNH